VTPGLGDPEGSGDLCGAAGGDAPEMEAVLTLAAPALAEVEGNGGGGAAELLGKVRVALGDGGEGFAQGADEVEGDIEGIEGPEGSFSGGGCPSWRRARDGPT
jgi:hypothetical protein